MANRLVVESVASESVLRDGAVAEDIDFVETFANADRRCEVLAWRTIVRRELGRGVEIFYDEYGAPKVDVPNTNISVSHSKGSVAVLFSDNPCAVDIEHTNRDFRRVANRYLAQSEQKLAEQYDIFAEMWCAKEALYKYYKKGNLDLVKHISIGDYDSDRGVLRCSILGSEPIGVKIEREGILAIAVID